MNSSSRTIARAIRRHLPIVGGLLLAAGCGGSTSEPAAAPAPEPDTPEPVAAPAVEAPPQAAPVVEPPPIEVPAAPPEEPRAAPEAAAPAAILPSKIGRAHV